MNLAFRDGKFDVVVAAGPRVETWPSAGVRSLSVLCAEMGLSVGQFGGDALTVRGVIPLPGTGGLVLIEDIQKRIHRIHARAIVRVLPDSTLPDPFPGWRSQGLLPLATAERLRRESQILWDPITAILGTGNRALRFGTTLLESGVPQVVCIETHSQWSAKRFAGWEVERRRFEMAGGKITEAKPLQLIPKGPLLWQLRLQDSHGIRVLDVGRVVSAGPFRNLQGVREHPPGSFLYELDQTAATTHAEDVEGWVLEEERGNWLAGKIVKALTSDLGHKREDLDRVFRRARGRLKRYLRHREEPFTPSYQGKWISVSESKFIRSFSGVPQQAQLSRPIASVECFEEIPCNICQKACPTSAIQIGKVPRNKYPILNESACIGCGLCVSACPTGTISMIQENESQSTSQLTLPWRGNKTWSPGESATLLNRRGESLGSARVLGPGGPEIGGEAAAFPEGSADLIPKIDPLPKGERNDKVQLVRVDLPTHLIWEARGIKKGRPPASSDEAYLASVDRASAAGEKVEITLNGEKRLVRDRIPISVALYEMGQSRPEDLLFCKDGSCGLCHITVDSVKKPACQTKIHRGMAIRIDPPPSSNSYDALCPCLGITREQVLERLQQGKLESPEALLSVTQVGEGKCHGQLCMGAFKRILLDQAIDISQWIDWRFPWADWIVTHG